MKAVVLEELNQPLTLREVGLTELKFGQVLVKVLVSGLCGSQLCEIKGHKLSLIHISEPTRPY